MRATTRRPAWRSSPPSGHQVCRTGGVASADAATIEALLRDLGFSYRAVAGGFDHVTQTTILDRDGKIYRHVYGDDFPLQMFMEPMKDVVYGTTTPFSLRRHHRPHQVHLHRLRSRRAAATASTTAWCSAA